MDLYAQLHLAARANQNDVRISFVGIGQDIGAARQAFRRRVFGTVKDGQCLTAEDKTGRIALRLDENTVSLAHLVGIRGAQYREAGDATQAQELFDRLMSRAIFADADGVMREDMKHRQFHQGSKADRRLHVVAENQERRTERAQMAKPHSVDDGAHGVFANAEMHVAAAGGLCLQCTSAIERQVGLGGWREIGSAAQNPRHILGDGVEHLPRGVACRNAFFIGLEVRQIGIPPHRQFVFQIAQNFVGGLRVGLSVIGEGLLPCGIQACAAFADAILEGVIDAVGHQKLCVFRPAVEALGLAHFLCTERVAVRGGGVLLVRRAIADDAVDYDQGRPVLGCLELFQRLCDRGAIIGICDMKNVPFVTTEARLNVLAEGKFGMAFDGDGIVVIDPAQIIEPEMSGDRCGFAGDALHHVAVAADHVDVVIEDPEAMFVVVFAQPSRSDGHADAVAAALAKRPGRGLDACGDAVFGMAGRDAVELPKFLDIVKADRGLAGDLALDRRFTVLFFIHLESRKVDIAGITVHPNEQWMRQMARNVTMEGCGTLRDCRYLLHDRDTKYTISFRAISESGQVETLLLPARSPNLNAYAERWVRSVKEECLSKIILFGERSLRRALNEYVTHYHAERNHQGKSNVLLFRRVTQTRLEEPVRCRERLGGLLNYYHQEAA